MNDERRIRVIKRGGYWRIVDPFNDMGVFVLSLRFSSMERAIRFARMLANAHLHAGEC